jgi:hypothetical protein
MPDKGSGEPKSLTRTPFTMPYHAAQLPARRSMGLAEHRAHVIGHVGAGDLAELESGHPCG